MPRRVNPLDEVIEDKGVRILVDPKAVLFLLGTEMDYKVDKLSAQFVFNNPNQTAACGCGEFGADRAGAGGTTPSAVAVNSSVNRTCAACSAVDYGDARAAPPCRWRRRLPDRPRR